MSANTANSRLRGRGNSLTNDDRIRQEAATILAQEGLGSVSLHSVAVRAGLSQTAMTRRYKDREAILCDVWKHRCKQKLARVISWADAELSAPTDTSIGNTESLIKNPDDDMLAFLELLAISATSPLLRRDTRATFTECFALKITNDPTNAAQTAFLVATILGVMMAQRAERIGINHIVTAMKELSTAVRNPHAFHPLPDINASHMHLYKFATGDHKRDAILESCLTNVGRYGFDRTTTKMIALDAGVSEGVIFAQFKSKLDIFVEASSRQSKYGFRANLEFIVNLNEKYGPGIANAVLIKKWLAPELKIQRSALLEETRLTWHNTDLRKKISQNKRDLLTAENIPTSTRALTSTERGLRFLQLSIPLGFYALAEVLPSAVDLPFTTVTQSVFA